MQNINLDEIHKDISNLLDKGLVNGKILLDRLFMINESSRKAPAYSDPRYSPFYYHLGKFLKPNNFLSLNFGLGLLESCFLYSCKSVQEIFLFRPPSEMYYSSRIGCKNIKRNFKGKIVFLENNIYDDLFLEKIGLQKWDLILINEQMSYDRHLEYMQFIWPYLAENGLLIAEYVNKEESCYEAFQAFGVNVNKKPFLFKTRYGTGIIQK